jgi:hypothetical protein
MALDGADKAHAEKEEASGVVLVQHSAFTDGDRELRQVMDEAEAERQRGMAEGVGANGSPLMGDYHAVRRMAKQAGLGDLDGSADPAAAVLKTGAADIVREDVKQAAKARRAAGQSGVTGRQSRHDAMVGGGKSTGGKSTGAAGADTGKSASTTGTATDDRGGDASVGQAPPSEGAGEPQNSDQDRPATHEESKARHTGTGPSTPTRGGRAASGK